MLIYHGRKQKITLSILKQTKVSTSVHMSHPFNRQLSCLLASPTNIANGHQPFWVNRCQEFLQSTRWWIFHCHLIFQSRQNPEEKQLILLMVQKSGDHQVEVGSLSHYLQFFFHPKGGSLGFLPSTVFFITILQKGIKPNPFMLISGSNRVLFSSWRPPPNFLYETSIACCWW